MSILGLGDEPKKEAAKSAPKATSKADTKKTGASGGQSDEAKAILKKMEAKKDAGDCAFC